jgi:endonuclease VIII
VAGVPEGDTVLRTARRLDAALADRVLIRAELRWPDLGDVDLAGRTVTEVRAYGKQILTRMGGEPGREPLTLRSHLRMEGRWSIAPPGPEHWPRGAGVSVRAVLANADWTAIGTWLGLLDLVPTAAEHTLIGHLGPDVMDPNFPEVGRAESIHRLALRPSATIGAALLDQTNVAGIGTMYMAETLFLGKVSPWTPTAEVDVGAVLDTARRLLLRGVELAVPTTTGNPRPGQNTFVHGRSGKPCRRCGATVRVASIGAVTKERTAFYCPVCQPGPTPTDDGRVRRPLGAHDQYRENRRPSGYRRSN